RCFAALNILTVKVNAACRLMCGLLMQRGFIHVQLGEIHSSSNVEVPIECECHRRHDGLPRTVRSGQVRLRRQSIESLRLQYHTERRHLYAGSKMPGTQRYPFQSGVVSFVALDQSIAIGSEREKERLDELGPATKSADSLFRMVCKYRSVVAIRKPWLFGD